MSEDTIAQDVSSDSPARKSPRCVQGLVVSSSMTKTLVVKTERLVQHAKYRKYVRKHTKYYAHDEASEAVVGDLVELEMCRPISKMKRWKLKRIVRMAPRDDVPTPQQMATEVVEDGDA
ncbi:MAG: 30S ribosomal protein S17 [Planctomycetota bacterium]|nr:30S ribosomal protein S17 [Planctomycetota bacterium]